MALLGALTGGFCMVVQSVGIFYPGPQNWRPNPGSASLDARGSILGQNCGPEKRNRVTGLVQNNISQDVFRGEGFVLFFVLCISITVLVVFPFSMTQAPRGPWGPNGSPVFLVTQWSLDRAIRKYSALRTDLVSPPTAA